MPKFNYKAKKGPEEIVENVIEAATKEEAVSRIHKMGYVPIKVTPLDKNAKGLAVGSKAAPSGIGFFNKVKSRDITIFIEQLASLVRSKIQVFEAINILSTQTESSRLKNIISSIADELKDGKTLSESMGRYPDVFPRLFVNMVSSGETGGVLEETLNRLSQFRQEEEDLRSRITSALAYPIFIMAVGCLTIFLLLTFGVPRLTFLFSDMGQALPVPTQILIGVSNGLRKYWIIGIGIIAAVFFIIKKQGIVSKNKMAVDNFKLKIPIFGEFQKQAMLARFSRTFSTLLANGIPVFQALAITIPSLENEVFKKEMQAIQADVIAGVSFAQSMRKSKWFPAFITNMIAISEKSGNLEGGLAEIAGFYEREVNKTMKIMTSLLEPVIILVMGIIVAFIVMAMILPIFELSVGMG